MGGKKDVGREGGRGGGPQLEEVCFGLVFQPSQRSGKGTHLSTGNSIASADWELKHMTPLPLHLSAIG